MQVIMPENEAHWLALRKTVLTSTDIAALFNLSPYQTYAELWYRKKGLIEPTFEETERIKWGNRLESAIAHGIAEDLDLKIRPMKEFIIDPDRRIGSSFDFAVEPDGLLEIKNVDSLQFREKWEIDDDGGIEAPPHIELQGQHELLISQRKHLRIGAFVGGNQINIIERDPDPQIQNAILVESAKFWESIDANQPPAPNFEVDADLISRLYGFAEPGKVLFFEQNQEFNSFAFDHKLLTDKIKELELRKDALKAQMLCMIGDAERVQGAGFSLTAGVQGPTDISAFTRKGFRMFRINWPRGKKQ